MSKYSNEFNLKVMKNMEKKALKEIIFIVNKFDKDKTAEKAVKSMKD